MSKNMLRNQAFHRDSLEVISDWRLLTFCSVLLLRNTVLMLQKNLQTCFDVACSRRSDRTRKTRMYRHTNKMNLLLYYCMMDT